MKAKEEKIREAYGEYWESVKDFVDENGWIINAISITRNVNLEMERWFDGSRMHVRPKSLQGIENNNQWLVFDGIKNINNLDCWVFTDKKRTLLLETYLKFSSINEFEKITHFQEIKKPLNPIF